MRKFMWIALVWAVLIICGILTRCIYEEHLGRTNEQVSHDNNGYMYSIYMQHMTDGRTLEAKADYPKAIALYRLALQNMDVFPEVRKAAPIAAHNRIAACYWKMHNNSAALSEFNISIGLGDSKYAPRSIAEIKSGKPPPSP